MISRGDEALGISSVPASYRAIFRVEHRAAGELVQTTERVWVQRPFASRIETYHGPPPGTRQESLRQSAFGVFASESAGAAVPLNIAAPPSLSSGDLRIDAVLEEAVESGALVQRERREVYGRECQVYRAGGPVLAGDITPYEAGLGEYADLCVDEHGLVIEEVWTSQDRLLRRRVATEVQVNPPMDRTLFDIEIPTNPEISRGAVARIEVEGIHEGGPPLWRLPEVPEGFEDLGEYAVVLSEQAVPRLDALTPAAAPSSTSDVYVRGPDLLVIDQGASLAELVTFESRPTHDVDLGELSEGKLIVDARMSEVRGVTPEGSLVRIFGTLAPDELLELARTLSPAATR